MVTKSKQTFKTKLQQTLRTASTGGRLKYRRTFLRTHPRDRAEHFFAQDIKTQQKLISYLTEAEIAEMFERIEPEDRLAHFSELKTPQAIDILSKMYVDDAVDILNQLDAEKAIRYLSLMNKTTAKKINELLRYEEATAGSLMTTEMISVKADATAGQALENLRRNADKAVTIYYIYVTDGKNHLMGVISLKELLLADKNTLVSNLGREHIIRITADEMKQEAAQLMRDYNLLALPVVDGEERLLGVITIDDIVDFIDDEASESFSKLAAVPDVELTDPPLVSAKKRLPWLILLLFLGMITASLIGQFEDTIAKIAILGAFIPVVAGTTGNSGTQSLAIVVRGIATGKLDKISLRKYFLKEALTALITSLAGGITLATIIYIWKGSLSIGLVAGSALTLSIFAGTLVGTAVPLIMRRLKIDPAVASGPLITTISDILSMAIYFGIATILISHLA